MSQKYINTDPLNFEETLNQELRIINAETCVYQLEYIHPNNYDKEELEKLYIAITNKIKGNDNKGLNYYNNKTKKRFQRKIWERQIQIDTKENNNIHSNTLHFGL